MVIDIDTEKLEIELCIYFYVYFVLFQMRNYFYTKFKHIFVVYL